VPFDRTLIPNPWPSAHAASVVALPGGRLLASWFAGSREGAPDVAIVIANFDGERWSEPRVAIDTPGRSDGNSVLWVDPAGVLRIWYVTMEGRGWATCPVRERRSHDGGETWPDAAYVREKHGWMVRNEPLRHAGRVLMPMYDERDWTAFVLQSGDGEAWTRSPKVYEKGTGLIQPAIAPAGDGRLLMLLRSTAGAVYAARSLDETGTAWTAPQRTPLPNPNSAVELIRLDSGTLLCVYNPTERGRTPLRTALSDDGGDTWPYWRDVESGPGEYSYPTAVQSADGAVHVLYTHQRRIAHARLTEDWIRGA
jgi:predicted neuraminidase